jgi:biotin carboxylase
VLPLDAVAREAASLPYPLVIKPLMLSGSRGVIRADDPRALVRAAALLGEILQQEAGSDHERSHCLVEEYLEGEEIALDGFVQNGRLLPLALFDKPEPLTGPYFEESCYITPSRLPRRLREEIVAEIERCCAAYGLVHGPIHAEARLTDRGVVLLEMAARTIGGQCGSTLQQVLGEPLEDLVLRLSCGESGSVIPESRGHAGVMMIPIEQEGLLKRVEGLLEARRTEHVSDIEIHIQPGYELVPLPRGSSYLGFIFARAEDYDAVWRALREAHGKLRFVTAPNWKLEPA